MTSRCETCRTGAIAVHTAERDLRDIARRAANGLVGAGAVAPVKAYLLNARTHHAGHKATCQHAKEGEAA